ncbi:MAG: carboxypeptidase regulatory-like domain-containing protein [Candidatus Omnitrophota bacterium]|jgi:hypothetical protein|nr:MAG: carboxypeptidase regulatory-like domain-containing protein [Candidatus Omnitrophota bacterium]
MNYRTLFFLLFVVGLGVGLGYLTFVYAPRVLTLQNGSMDAPRKTILLRRESFAENTLPISRSREENRPATQLLESATLIILVECQSGASDLAITVFVRDSTSEIAVSDCIASPTTPVPYIFNTLSVGNVYTVMVSAEGYIPIQHSVKLQNRETSLTLHLYPQVIVHLLCINEESEPVPGAMFEIRSQTGGIFAENMQANETGAATACLPHPGDYEIVASHPMYTETRHKAIHVTHNPNSHTFLLSRATGMIFGKATDESSRPVSGATISLYRQSKHNRMAGTTTDEDGNYVFTNLRLIDYFLNIEADDRYVNSDISYDSNRKEDALFPRITLTPEQPNAEIHFQLFTSITFYGKVVDASNQPISGALIKAGIQGTREKSIRPVFNDIQSDGNGEFTLPVKTRIQGWNHLLLSAIHPDYGNTSVLIENYAEKNQDEIIVLTLEKWIGAVKGTVVDFHSRIPISSVTFNVFPVSFQNDDRFRQTFVTNDQGEFLITLTENNYIFQAEKYSIRSPKTIYVNADQETKTTIFVSNIDEKKIRISGIVVNRDQIPIHGANLYVSGQNRMFGSTSSIPEGLYQLEINESTLQYEPIFHVLHPSYQTYEIPVMDIPDTNSFVVELTEHRGVVKAVLTGIEDCRGVQLDVMPIRQFNPIQTVHDAEQSIVFIQNIDESQGPFVIMAGGLQYAGISPVFDLRNVQSRYLELEIPMHAAGRRSKISIQVFDAQTREPVAIATCQIDGHSFNPAGVPSRFEKRAITRNNGIAILENVPICIGALNIRHVFYKETTLPFHHDGTYSNNRIVVSLEKKEGIK